MIEKYIVCPKCHSTHILNLNNHEVQTKTLPGSSGPIVPELPIPPITYPSTYDYECLDCGHCFNEFIKI